jgi:hypothetical protein
MPDVGLPAMFDVPQLLIEMVVLAVQGLRLARRRRQSRNWPLVTGTMQRAFVLPGWGYWSTQQYRSIFGYAFPANGSRYAGFVALQASDEQDADTLQKKLPGTSVMVRYDPGNPGVSILEEELIVGRRLTQNPHWLP